VMSKIIGIDMHNHVYPAGTEPHPQRGQSSQQEEPPPDDIGKVGGVETSAASSAK
jgi:hypothetical protein